MSIPAAAEINIIDTLSLLDGSCGPMAEAISEGQYTLWLGSGISRGRVNNLFELISKVLEHFRQRIDQSDPMCPNRKALEEILQIANLPAPYRATLDSYIASGIPVTKWPKTEQEWTIGQLVSRYDQVLDVQVMGKVEEDYILWSVVDVANTYVDGSLQPDCEHLCVGILVSEGVISDIATANWDGLIEAAGRELQGGRLASIKVCVRAEDLRGRATPARLIKFHGCAVRALKDEAIYRPLLIARRSQILVWPDPTAAAINHELVSLASRTRTLMVGLSAQDDNIKRVFNSAQNMISWSWPSPDPPAIVFAENDIGKEQEYILKIIYKKYFAANVDSISQSALIRAFSKPLLTALVLHVICSKLRKLTTLVNAPNLSAVDLDELAEEIRSLRNRVAAAAEDIKDADGKPDRLGFIREVVRQASRVLGLFRHGQLSASSRTYLPLGTLPIHQIESDPNLEPSGQREMAAALALLGRGEKKNIGKLKLGDSVAANGGALTFVRSANIIRLFFAADNAQLVQMMESSRVTIDDDDAVVIQSGPVAAHVVRSPSGTYGRTGKASLRVVGMSTLLMNAANVDVLFDEFFQEVGA